MDEFVGIRLPIVVLESYEINVLVDDKSLKSHAIL